MHSIRSGTCSYQEFELAYEAHGPDQPQRDTVLLVHGVLLDTYVNRDIAGALVKAGYRVILLDLLGHGRSDAPADAHQYRLERFAEQVITAMDHLQLSKVILGGISLGTITALHVAAQHPARVQAMLLEMPVMEHAAPAAALMLTPVLLAARYGARMYRPVAHLLQKLPPPKINVWHSLFNAVVRDPEVTSAILHGLLVGPVVPPISQRRAIQAPTLVIGHAGDWLHPFDDARALAQELPNARFIKADSILELRTRPDRLMPRIVEFLSHEVTSGNTKDPSAAQPRKRKARASRKRG